MKQKARLKHQFFEIEKFYWEILIRFYFVCSISLRSVDIRVYFNSLFA